MNARRVTLIALLCAGGVARAEVTDDNPSCLDCHQDEAASMPLGDGSSLSLFVDPRDLGSSVHRERLQCTDCHRLNGAFPHLESTWRSRRDYSAAQSAVCRRCHFANYARTLESVHARIDSAAARGPTCVDCHGAHAMQPPAQPRAAISRRCGSCHEKEFTVYARSVHGAALLDEDNADVPVCTDCHRAHDIADPHGDDFDLRIPPLCGRCHADEARMGRYGLSTDVLRSYLTDFHGVTSALYRQTEEQGRLVAVCTDCHGVHDIAKTRGADLAPLKARLGKSCVRCHEGAPVRFPDAWLPHYEASFTKAPLVLAVRAFRWVLLPIVVGGLLLQILLHIYRLAANRW